MKTRSNLYSLKKLVSGTATPEQTVLSSYKMSGDDVRVRANDVVAAGARKLGADASL